MSRAALASACALLAAGLVLATTLAGAALRPGYSHCAQYISELGELGAPHAAAVNGLGFLPAGALVLAFCALAGARSEGVRARLGWLCVSGIGWAYAAAAFFPCDPGCPSDGPLRQQLHSAGALAAYVGAPIGFLLLRDAVRPRALSPICAALVLLGFLAMLTPALAPQRGLAQRAAEAALFAWIVAAALALRDAPARIYHLVTASDWQRLGASGGYAPESLGREGFVHCAADEAQTLAVARGFFAQLREPLLLLAIDPSRLSARVVFEAAAPAGGVAMPAAEAERFPHVYGPIERTAIAGIAALGHGDGRFAWPARFEAPDTA
jgi:uncharacterized protein (DUF952 family)